MISRIVFLVLAGIIFSTSLAFASEAKIVKCDVDIWNLKLKISTDYEGAYLEIIFYTSNDIEKKPIEFVSGDYENGYEVPFKAYRCEIRLWAERHASGQGPDPHNEESRSSGYYLYNELDSTTVDIPQ